VAFRIFVLISHHFTTVLLNYLPIMRKLITFFSLLLVLTFAAAPAAQAQGNYGTALGLRFGYHYGLSLKHFMKNNLAIEGILSSRGFGNNHWGRNFGFNLTVLAEWHNPIGSVDGLAWYIGFGGHLGSWHSNNYNNRNWSGSGDRHFVIGVDGIIGLEYTIPNAPITLALDWKPAFDFLGGLYFAGDGAALTLRFTLK
jgi:hypothetical protein